MTHQATASEAVPSSGLLGRRLDRIARPTRRQRRWIVVLSALMAFDMADLTSFAVAAPAVRADWRLGIDDIATVTSAAFLGMFIGSLLGGWLSDRFGRRRTIVWATLGYSAASLASAFSQSLWDLAILRVLTGLGLMAATTAMLTYVSEMFPREHRGRVQSLIVAIGLLGIPAMSWSARWLVPLGESAWRWVFVLGAAGAVVALVANWVLPESVRWLDVQGRSTEALATVELLEDEASQLRDEPANVTAPVVEDAGGFAALVGERRLRRRTIVLSVSLMLATLTYYGFNAWVPTLLVDHGMTASQSLTYVSILALAACPGALLAIAFVDRWERRYVICGVYITVGALILAFGLAPTTPVLLASGLLMMLFVQIGTASFYTYMPEVFPTAMRSSGVGVANGSGRIATFAGTFLVAAILTNLGYLAVFVFLCVCSVSVGLLMGCFGERTNRRSLEEISAKPTGVAPEAAK